MKMSHPQAIQEADEFICSSEQIGNRMGAVRMRVQTADKNITIIHTTPVHQLTSWEDKSCVFERNKSIIKPFLPSNCHFQLKYEYDIAFLSGLNQERNMHRSNTVYEQKQSKTALNICVCGFWWERTTGDGLFHWSKRYYGLWSRILAGSDRLK